MLPGHFLWCNDFQLAHVAISPKGIKFTVEVARCFQANTFLQSELFQEYTFKGDEPEEFSIQLSGTLLTSLEFADRCVALLDCLNIFGTQTTTATLQLAYQVSFSKKDLASNVTSGLWKASAADD